MSHISKELISKAAEFFRVVGDETRMKILCTIAGGELCVNDIAAEVVMTKSAVSHPLRLFMCVGLVKMRRDGINMFYSVDVQHVVDIIDIAFIHIEHKMHGAGCGCAHCHAAHDPHCSHER